MSIEFFKERQNVVLEGAIGDKFYIIHTGRVGVFKGVKSEIGSIILVSSFVFKINKYSEEWLI